MVKGLDIFKEYFREYSNQYVLIGGAACDIFFSNNNIQFRVTRDLDIVLIVDALKIIVGYDKDNKPIYEVVLKLNKYKFEYNNNGYIIGYYSVNENEDWYGQASVIEKEYGISLAFGCFKFVNNEIVKDEAEYQRLHDIEIKQARINELKQKLNDTDYIHAVLAEKDASEEYYAEVIENRKAWRAEIRELEDN